MNADCCAVLCENIDSELGANVLGAEFLIEVGEYYRLAKWLANSHQTSHPLA